jgi:hypothetical protein
MKYLIYFLITLSPFIWSKQINGNYFNAKMFLIYLISGLCVASIAFFQKRSLKFQLPKAFQISILFFALYMLFKPALSHHFFSYFYIFKPMAFIAIAYFVALSDLSLIENKYIQSIFSVLVCVLIGLHIFEIFDFRFIQGTLDHGQMLGTFGNVNMLSEFFILFLPFIYIWTKQTEKFPQFLKYVALSLWVFIIIYTRSRSSWIGLALFIAFVLFRNFNKKDLFSFSIGLLLYIACLVLPTTKESFVDKDKQNSFHERISLYKSAVQMMVDHPMGMGLGTFVNELIPYRLHQDYKPSEFEYADQPHSEILKWGVQFGWTGFLLSLGILGYIFIQLLRTKNDFLFSFLLTLMPQIFFQFPFENPMGILLIGIFTGLWLKTKSQTIDQTANWKLKTALGIISIFAVVHSFIFISSIVIESQFFKDEKKTSLMCSIYPVNHRNCNFKNVLLLEKNAMTQFRVELKNELEFSYLTSDLQRILPIYFQRNKDEKHLCESLLIYKMMYPKQKYFNPQDLEFCSKYTSPIQYQNPIQFRSDYKNWIEGFFL